MKRILLIDTENVGHTWLNIKGLEKNNKNIEVILFYTFYSAHNNLENDFFDLYEGYNVKEIECLYGKNALDFQLISYAGYLIKKNGSKKIYIVSKDKGYDTVIRELRSFGYNIFRIRPNGELI